MKTQQHPPSITPMIRTQERNHNRTRNDNDNHSHSHSHNDYVSGEHEIPLFRSEPGVVSPQHAAPVAPECREILQSLSMKTNSASPSPHSENTSGSTTASTTSAVSSSGEALPKSMENAADFQKDHPLGASLQAPIDQGAPSNQREPVWPIPFGSNDGQAAFPPFLRSPVTPLSPFRDDDHDPTSQAQPPPPPPSSRQSATPQAHPCVLKLLVSNNVAGSIIGRSGQTISELQSQSSARIKLSQTGDYYPGTQDRVCLVQGEAENVKTALRLLLERLRMLQDQQHSQQSNWKKPPEDAAATTQEHEFIVRILVPSSSCGMIIGKAGSNIKTMEQKSGVSSIRLSPKESIEATGQNASNHAGTSERLVTLTAPKVDNCLQCMYIILDGMSVHPEICRYANMTTSYSRLVAPTSSYEVVQAPPRPLLVMPPPGRPDPSQWDPNFQPFPPGQDPGKTPFPSNEIPGPMNWDQRGGPDGIHERVSGDVSQNFPRDNMPGYGPGYGREVPHPQYPIVPHSTHPPGRGSSIGNNLQPVYLHATPPSRMLDPRTPDALAGQLHDSLRISNHVDLPAPASNLAHFVPQMPHPTPPGFTVEILVPDTMVGSILGRGGRTLSELQVHSGTRIKISQRGDYIPGTRNRVVTIRGPTAQSVSVAQYMMSQRMVLPPSAVYSPPFHNVPLMHPDSFQQAHPQQIYQESMPMPTNMGVGMGMNHSGQLNDSLANSDGQSSDLQLSASAIPPNFSSARNSSNED